MKADRERLIAILQSLSARSYSILERRAYYGSALSKREDIEDLLELRELYRVYQGTFDQLERLSRQGPNLA